MNDTEQNRIINRIRKMMRLANDAGATEGERDNALRMAHATLAKYNLDMTQIEVDGDNDLGDGRRPQEPREQAIDTFLGKPWALRIAQSVAHLYFCFYYYYAIKGAGGPNAKARHVFVGRHSNAVTAQEMAKFLVGAVNREAQKYQRDNFATYREYRAFAQAAAMRIAERCRQIREASEGQQAEQKIAPSGPGTAIVLADIYRTEQDANHKYLEKQGVKLGKGRQESYASDASARAAGHAYGSSVSLNRQLKGN